MKSMMITVRFLCLLILAFSCSTRKIQEKFHQVQDNWKGRSAEELKTHPYFRYLRVEKIHHEDQTETWIYRDQSRIQTSAYCDSMGGCMGMPFYNCDTAFSICSGQIQGMQQNGGCPGPEAIAPVKRSKE